MEKEYKKSNYSRRVINEIVSLTFLMILCVHSLQIFCGISMIIIFDFSFLGWTFGLLVLSMGVYFPIRYIWVNVKITQVVYIQKIKLCDSKISFIYFNKDVGPTQLDIIIDKELIINYHMFYSRGWNFKTPYIELINSKQNLDVKFYSNLNFGYEDMLEIKKAIEIAQGKPQFNYDKYGSGW